MHPWSELSVSRGVYAMHPWSELSVSRGLYAMHPWSELSISRGVYAMHPWSECFTWSIKSREKLGSFFRLLTETQKF